MGLLGDIPTKLLRVIGKTSPVFLLYSLSIKVKSTGPVTPAEFKVLAAKVSVAKSPVAPMV